MPRRRHQTTPWDRTSAEQRRKSSAFALCGFCVYRASTGKPNEAAHYKYACRSPETAFAVHQAAWSPPCTSIVKEQGGCDLFTVTTL